MGYNKGMNNDIVQLTDKNGNNVYPVAGAATQDSISKSMLEEGVFEGPELFPAPAEAYVRTADIVDDAVTSDKIDWTTINYGSTTEDVVVGVYDGSPVYRHVEEFTTSSSGWLPTNLARPISNFEKLIDVFGSMHQTATGVDNWFPVLRVRPTNATYAVGVATVNGTSITFDIGPDVNGQKDIIVFIDYTKSS